MAQIGVLTTEFTAPSFADVLAAIAGHGVSCVQLQLGSLLPQVPRSAALLQGLDVLAPLLTPALVASAADELTARGIAVAAVDGAVNLAHPDAAYRVRALRQLAAVIEYAPALGTRIVTLCTGTRATDSIWRHHDENSSARAWRDLVDGLRSIVPVAERAGVVLAFEPEHNNVVDTARRARELLDEIESPALKVLLDVANLFQAGDLARMEDHLAEVFALLGDHIVLAHAKDLDHDGDAGGRAAGQGRLDYGGYLRGLQACGFDGAIVLHQLGELAPDRVDQAFAHVRSHAPAGYLA